MFCLEATKWCTYLFPPSLPRFLLVCDMEFRFGLYFVNQGGQPKHSHLLQWDFVPKSFSYGKQPGAECGTWFLMYSTYTATYSSCLSRKPACSSIMRTCFIRVQFIRPGKQFSWAMSQNISVCFTLPAFLYLLPLLVSILCVPWDNLSTVTQLLMVLEKLHWIWRIGDSHDAAYHENWCVRCNNLVFHYFPPALPTLVCMHYSSSYFSSFSSKSKNVLSDFSRGQIWHGWRSLVNFGTLSILSLSAFTSFALVYRFKEHPEATCRFWSTKCPYNVGFGSVSVMMSTKIAETA